MQDKISDLNIIGDADLDHIFGGSAAPKKNFMPTEGQKLTGAAVTGAVGGLVAGAPGGPAGMAAGALIGVGLGIGGYAVNGYVNGGNRNNIPPTPVPFNSCNTCHGNNSGRK